MCVQQIFSSAWASTQSYQSLRCPPEEGLGPKLPLKRAAKTDQTGRMPRLILVFAVRAGNLVCFFMLQLKCSRVVCYYVNQESIYNYIYTFSYSECMTQLQLPREYPELEDIAVRAPNKF